MNKLLLGLVAAIALACPALAQSIPPGLPLIPMGYCQISAAQLASSVGLASCVRASFTGTGSGTTLTAASVTGFIRSGDAVTGTGVPAGTTIVTQLTGTTGGAGTYQTSAATTSSSASLTSGGIPVDDGGRLPNYMILTDEVAATGVRWRGDGGAPTATIGNLLPPSTPFTYPGPASAIRFIAQTGSPILNIAFYRSP